MCRQVSITESEPVGIGSVGGQFLLGVPGFVRAAPTAAGVDAAAEGVHAGIEVGTDPHAVHPHVVAHIDDGSDVMVARRIHRIARLAQWRRERCGAQKRTHSEQESGAADTAGEHGHFHRNEYRGAVGKGRIDMDGSSVLT